MHDQTAARLLRKIQTERPAVHCLTNTVVQGITANMLLALGALPSMSADISEVTDFVGGADALLVNLGTLDAARKAAIAAAIDAAQAKSIPWILDPVLIDRAPARLSYARELIGLKPSLIRGNAGEIAAFGSDPKMLAAESGAIVAVTGVSDFITDGTADITLEGGHSLMSRVTGIGCAGTALISAFCAVAGPETMFDAVASGLALLNTAGEKAAGIAAGPGGFAAEILDQIYFLSQSSLQESKEI